MDHQRYLRERRQSLNAVPIQQIRLPIQQSPYWTNDTMQPNSNAQNTTQQLTAPTPSVSILNMKLMNTPFQCEQAQGENTANSLETYTFESLDIPDSARSLAFAVPASGYSTSNQPLLEVQSNTITTSLPSKKLPSSLFQKRDTLKQESSQTSAAESTIKIESSEERISLACGISSIPQESAHKSYKNSLNGFWNKENDRRNAREDSSQQNKPANRPTLPLSVNKKQQLTMDSYLNGSPLFSRNTFKDSATLQTNQTIKSEKKDTSQDQVVVVTIQDSPQNIWNNRIPTYQTPTLRQMEVMQSFGLNQQQQQQPCVKIVEDEEYQFDPLSFRKIWESTDLTGNQQILAGDQQPIPFYASGQFIQRDNIMQEQVNQESKKNIFSSDKSEDIYVNLQQQIKNELHEICHFKSSSILSSQSSYSSSIKEEERAAPRYHFLSQEMAWEQQQKQQALSPKRASHFLYVDGEQDREDQLIPVGGVEYDLATFGMKSQCGEQQKQYPLQIFPEFSQSRIEKSNQEIREKLKSISGVKTPIKQQSPQQQLESRSSCYNSSSALEHSTVSSSMLPIHFNIIKPAAEKAAIQSFACPLSTTATIASLPQQKTTNTTATSLVTHQTHFSQQTLPQVHLNTNYSPVRNTLVDTPSVKAVVTPIKLRAMPLLRDTTVSPVQRVQQVVSAIPPRFPSTGGISTKSEQTKSKPKMDMINSRMNTTNNSMQAGQQQQSSSSKSLYYKNFVRRVKTNGESKDVLAVKQQQQRRKSTSGFTPSNSSNTSINRVSKLIDEQIEKEVITPLRVRQAEAQQKDYYRTHQKEEIEEFDEPNQQQQSTPISAYQSQPTIGADYYLSLPGKSMQLVQQQQQQQQRNYYSNESFSYCITPPAKQLEILQQMNKSKSGYLNQSASTASLAATSSGTIADKQYIPSYRIGRSKSTIQNFGLNLPIRD